MYVFSLSLIEGCLCSSRNARWLQLGKRPEMPHLSYDVLFVVLPLRINRSENSGIKGNPPCRLSWISGSRSENRGFLHCSSRAIPRIGCRWTTLEFCESSREWPCHFESVFPSEFVTCEVRKSQNENYPFLLSVPQICTENAPNFAWVLKVSRASLIGKGGPPKILQNHPSIKFFRITPLFLTAKSPGKSAGTFTEFLLRAGKGITWGGNRQASDLSICSSVLPLYWNVCVRGSAGHILGLIFYLGLANFRKIAHIFLREFFQRFFPADFSALFLQGFRPPQKFAPKIHVQNSRHSSPTSHFRTQTFLTLIFYLRFTGETNFFAQGKKTSKIGRECSEQVSTLFNNVFCDAHFTAPVVGYF